MARKRWDVVPSGSYWAFTTGGSNLSTRVTKADAINAGASVARANQPSQLVIHLANGTIEDERTYGDGPYPPSG